MKRIYTIYFILFFTALASFANSKTPAYILEKLATDNSDWVRLAVLSNSNTPIGIIRSLAKVPIMDNYGEEYPFNIVLVSNPNTPIDILIPLMNNLLTKNKDSEYDWMLDDMGVFAKNPEFINYMATKDNLQINIGLAANPNTPISVLENLAEKDNDEINQSLAANNNTPVNILRNLVNRSLPIKTKTDEFYSKAKIKLNLATNPNTPVDVLRKLAETNIIFNGLEHYSHVYDLYLELCRNSNTPQDVLIKIASYDNYDKDFKKYNDIYNETDNEKTSENYHYRTYLLDRDNLSNEVLAILISDEDADISKEAAQYPIKNSLFNNCDDLSDLDLYSSQDLLQDPKTSPETLKMFAENTNYYLRSEVARHPNTPIETLEKLANDESEEVRVRVAANLNTTIKTLENLANDKSEEVRVRVAANPNTPIKTLENLANDENEMVRRSVAWNDYLSFFFVGKVDLDFRLFRN